MEKKKAKLVFASRLAPKKDDVEGNDLGIQISSKLQPRLPVVVAAGRTGDGIDVDGIDVDGWG